MSEKAEKNSKSLVYIILLIVLMVILAVVSFLYFKTNTKYNELSVEKEQMRLELKSELDSLLVEHSRIKSEYGQLADSLVLKDSLILANATEITELLNYKWEYFQVKKKLDRLRDVAQVYVRQLDSLYTVNDELKEENVRIRENYRSEKVKNTELTEEKQNLEKKFTDAAILRANNIVATGIKERGSKQIETDKASRTDQVRICFTIGQNTLVDFGKKTVYLRIARPDKVILMVDQTDEYSFLYQGQRLQYSIKQDFDYKGQPIDLCVFWKKVESDQSAMVGRYNVTLYYENEVIGESYFDLR
jgi:hypothetical protein